MADEPEDWAAWQKAALDEAKKCVPEDYALAEELAGRAIEKILKAEGRPTAPLAIRSYARAVVKNVFADRQRKVQFRVGHGIHYEMAESTYQDVQRGKVAVTIDRVQQGMIYDVIHADEEAWALKNFQILIAELPELEQTLFNLYMQGVNPSEIAEQLGFKDGKVVTTRVGQIRTRLSEEFKKRWPIET